MYSADLVDKVVENDINFHGYADDTQLYVHCRPEEIAATRNYSQSGTLHHRHGQLDVCEQTQVKYGQDGAAVRWNKIQHVDIELLRFLSTAQQRHCQGKSTCTHSSLADYPAPRTDTSHDTSHFTTSQTYTSHFTPTLFSVYQCE